MKLLVPIRFPSEVPPGFLWRDRFGNGFPPDEMETSHLFYTLRMIWNNFMPPELQVGEVKLYCFPSFYTDEYLACAIVALGRELSTRPDLPPWMRRELRQMHDHLLIQANQRLDAEESSDG